MGQEQFGRGNVQAAAREMGRWINVPFKASNFKGAGPITWTVTEAQVINNRYCRIGNAVVWCLRLGNTTISGGSHNTVILIPPLVERIASYCPNVGFINSSGVYSMVAVGVAPAQPPNFPTQVLVNPIPLASLPLGPLQLFFTITYEVN
jgi:hypothetical protein